MSAICTLAVCVWIVAGVTVMTRMPLASAAFTEAESAAASMACRTIASYFWLITSSM